MGKAAPDHRHWNSGIVLIPSLINRNLSSIFASGVVNASKQSLKVFRSLAMSQIRKQASRGLTVGATFSVSRQFTEQDIRTFADISRDYNPIHFDDRFVRAKSLKGRICHGLLVGSLLTEIGGQIGWLASEMNFQFKRPVYFGDTIECSLTITEIDSRNRARARATYRNQEGIIVLEAELAGILPGDREREILGAILTEGNSAHSEA
jgi:3-hydroxybutyryl-CoA dehydratase